jgi:hypothetical protein
MIPVLRSPTVDLLMLPAAISEQETFDAPATIYEKDGSFLLPCKIPDLSKTGGRLELFKEAVLPQYFLMSLLPDGSGRRLCSKVWRAHPDRGRPVCRQGADVAGRSHRRETQRRVRLLPAMTSPVPSFLLPPPVTSLIFPFGQRPSTTRTR